MATASRKDLTRFVPPFLVRSRSSIDPCLGSIYIQSPAFIKVDFPRSPEVRPVYELEHYPDDRKQGQQDVRIDKCASFER